jgi:hypothetical protein
MKKQRQELEQNPFFGDEIILSKSSNDGYIDDEYYQFKDGVLAGKITEMDCKNPMWLELYQKIRKEHSKVLVHEIAQAARGGYTHPDDRDLKFDEYRDINPDDHD